MILKFKPLSILGMASILLCSTNALAAEQAVTPTSHIILAEEDGSYESETFSVSDIAVPTSPLMARVSITCTSTIKSNTMFSVTATSKASVLEDKISAQARGYNATGGKVIDKIDTQKNASYAGVTAISILPQYTQISNHSYVKSGYKTITKELSYYY